MAMYKHPYIYIYIAHTQKLYTNTHIYIYPTLYSYIQIPIYIYPTPHSYIQIPTYIFSGRKSHNPKEEKVVYLHYASNAPSYPVVLVLPNLAIIVNWPSLA